MRSTASGDCRGSPAERQSVGRCFRCGIGRYRSCDGAGTAGLDRDAAGRAQADIRNHREYAQATLAAARVLGLTRRALVLFGPSRGGIVPLVVGGHGRVGISPGMMGAAGVVQAPDRHGEHQPTRQNERAESLQNRPRPHQQTTFGREGTRGREGTHRVSGGTTDCYPITFVGIPGATRRGDAPRPWVGTASKSVGFARTAI